MGANTWSASRTHGRGRYRENTLKSFREAVRCGATFIEFDVQTTADGVPIIWHDNYIVSTAFSRDPFLHALLRWVYVLLCLLSLHASTGSVW